MSESCLFGFQEHLSAEFPSQVVLDVTEYCNLECIHCPHPEYKKSDIWQGSHMPVDLHNKLIDEIETYGKGITRYIRYTANGEPLIHPKFSEMVAYAGKTLSATSINVTTNAKSLTEKRTRELLEAGVDVFDISLDAHTEETYDSVRPKGNFKRTVENVKRLLTIIKNENYSAKLVLSFVKQPANENEAEDFEAFWKDAGADYVVIRRLHSAAGAKKDALRVIESSRYPCLYPWERITLSADGMLRFCPQDWLHKSTVADYREKSVREIWNSEFMQSLRNAHICNDFSSHKFCGQCQDWSVTRWPGQGRAYSDMMKELIPVDLLE